MPPIRSTLIALSLVFAPAAFAQLAPLSPDAAIVAPAQPDTVPSALPSLIASQPPAAQPEELLPEAPLPQQPLNAAVPPSAPQETVYPVINGQPYRAPTHGELTRYYVHSMIGKTGQAAVFLRAIYGEAVDTPSGWDQNWTGFGQRIASNEGITVINQTTKFALSTAFHEDFRYFRCRGCTYKEKISNVLLAEVTARHGADGHRMFSITPIASHIAGTEVAHAAWYPPGNDGFGRASSSVAVALITQVGIHVFQEFFLRHTEENLPDRLQKFAKFLPGHNPPKPITD